MVADVVPRATGADLGEAVTIPVRYDGADLLPAGIAGEGLGALLQRAIRGDTIDWADFQTRVKAAWDAE